MIRVKGMQEAFCPDSGVLRFCLYYAYIVKIPEAADRVVQRNDRRVVPFLLQCDGDGRSCGKGSGRIQAIQGVRTFLQYINSNN